MPTLRKRLPKFSRPERRSRSLDGFSWGSGLTGPVSMAGPIVNTRSSLGVAAVWGAVGIYANTIATLDLSVSRRDDRGGRRPAYDHPINPLIATRPNPTTSSFRLRQSLIMHALTTGNGFCEIERDGRGDPVGLHLIDPWDCQPMLADDGSLTYRVNCQSRDLLPHEVLHVAGMGWDGVRGYSPISLFRETLGLAIGERDHTASLMGNNATPTGHFELPGKLSAQAKGTFREQVNSVHQGPRKAGQFGILDNGATWKQTSFSPADTELIQSREFSIGEVARIFGIPQHLLGLLEHSSFSTNEEQNIQFYQMSIMPWLVNIQQELNFKLLRPDEQAIYSTSFDVGSLLRGNQQAQTAWVKDMFGMGMISRNEGRMRFGIPPVDGSDDMYIPSNNLTPVGTSTEPEPSLDLDDPVD
jgi:HK97 family phage portal protein